LRAILNLTLGDTKILQPGAMINLLGEKGFEGRAIYQGIENCIKMPGIYPHIYGKEITKPYRKMGHITITGDNIVQVKEKAKEVKKHIHVIS
jgi:5-(carboxyamino)imidazole ribonucleotide synthase